MLHRRTPALCVLSGCLRLVSCKLIALEFILLARDGVPLGQSGRTCPGHAPPPSIEHCADGPAALHHDRTRAAGGAPAALGPLADETRSGRPCAATSTSTRAAAAVSKTARRRRSRRRPPRAPPRAPAANRDRHRRPRHPNTLSNNGRRTAAAAANLQAREGAQLRRGGATAHTAREKRQKS